VKKEERRLKNTIERTTNMTFFKPQAPPLAGTCWPLLAVQSSAEDKGMKAEKGGVMTMKPEQAIGRGLVVVVEGE